MVATMRVASVYCSLYILLALTGSLTGSLVNQISSDKFRNDIVSTSVFFVQFYTKYSPEISNFLPGFREASTELLDYGVNLATVNCNEDPVEEYCNRDGIDSKILVFRQGSVISQLDFSTLYNADAIVSHALLLVLSGDVPIIQPHVGNLEKLVKQNKGKRDVLVGLLDAVGTYDHRVFMEAAFAYGDKYKFAYMFQNDVTEEFHFTFSDYGAESGASIWLMLCEHALTDDECSKLRYPYKLSLPNLVKFFKESEQPMVFDISGQEHFQLLMVQSLNVAFVLSNTEMSSAHLKLTQEISQQFFGRVKFYFINIEKAQEKLLEDIQFKRDFNIPAFALKKYLEDDLLFMKDDFNHGNIIHFLTENVVEYQNGEKETEEQLEEQLGAETPPQEVEDDAVADAVHNNRHRKLETQFIPALTDKDFPLVIGQDGCRAVLFYVPWSPVSMAFMEPYANAGKQLVESLGYGQSPLGRISCSDWPDVCQKHNITVYPLLKIFCPGREPYIYWDSWSKVWFLRVFLMLQSAPVVELKTVEEATQFTDYHLPAWLHALKVKHLPLALGLFATSNVKEVEAFRQAAETLWGRYVFGASTSNEVNHYLLSKFSTTVPSVVILKRFDPFEPYTSLINNFTTEGIVHFTQHSTLEVFPELTYNNFVRIFKRKLPILICFENSTEEVSIELHNHLGNLAISKKFAITFAWMPTELNNSLAYNLLSLYSSLPRVPSLVLVSHAHGSVWIQSDQSHMTQTGISDWLTDIENGHVQPVASLKTNEWLPAMAGYDFLSFIEAEEKANIKDQAASTRRRFQPSESNKNPREIKGQTMDASQSEKTSGIIHTEL